MKKMQKVCIKSVFSEKKDTEKFASKVCSVRKGCVNISIKSVFNEKDAENTHQKCVQ
jgi:hypothetical protein